MKMLKKLGVLALALMMVICLVSCGEKADDKLVIGYTIYEPMNYMEDGKLTGFDTEFAEAVCGKLGVTPEFVEINWDTKEVELEANLLLLMQTRLTVSGTV